MMKTILVPAVVCAALLGGCFGGDTNVKVEGATTVSKGQELQDLQTALQMGAISQGEYESLRSKIMKRPN